MARGHISTVAIDAFSALGFAVRPGVQHVPRKTRLRYEMTVGQSEFLSNEFSTSRRANNNAALWLA